MAAVWLRFRSELRTRWRAWLGLALLVGIAGGVVIALAAGARRTDSAYPRLIDVQRPPHVVVFEGGFNGDVATAPNFLDRVADLPTVVEAIRLANVFGGEGRTNEGLRIGEPDYLQTIVPVNERAAGAIARQRLLDGRHPRPNAVKEVAIGFTVADRYDLDVNDTFELELLTEAQGIRLYEEGTRQRGVTRGFKVVGITAAAGDFPPRSLGDGAGFVTFTPAFAAANSERVGIQAVAARLRNGLEDLPAFEAAAEDIAGGAPFDAFGAVQTKQHEATERAIDLLTVALWVLTGLGAVAAVLVSGQAITRLTVVESAEHPTLRALGLDAWQLGGVALVRAALMAASAALLAVGAAVLLSPLFPLGLARTAEPDPGVAVDWVALVTGAGAVVGGLMLLAALAAWRVSRSAGPAGAARPSTVAGLVARWGMPAPAVAGVRMAFDPGRGGTAVPARSTLAGAAVGVAALAGALTFAASLDRLLGTPSLYGWNWDITVGDGIGADAHDDVAPVLEDDRGVEAFASGTFVAVDIEGREVFALATDVERGSVGPTVVEGRAPGAPDEILLGTETLEAVGIGVGEKVGVRFLGTFEGEATTGDAKQRTLTVVGRGVLPEQSDVGLDDAAAITYEGARRLAPDEPLRRNFFPVRLADGVNADRKLEELRSAVGTYTVPRQRPTDLVNFGRVDALPLVGAGLLTLVAAAMMTHLLLSSIRRRRRDLALLKTLGFTGRQVSTTVASQASTLAIVALLAGLPLGVAAGRWAWTVAAERLGVVAEPVVPLLALLAAAPLTLVAANLVAAVPAWFAARTRPAVLLRAE